MVADALPAIEAKAGGEFSYAVHNWNRSIGARLSGEIARRHGNQGMADAPITVRLTGTAGQSFGVWNAGGLHLYLEGDANDYVGKGMAGGKLVIHPPREATFEAHETTSSSATPACTAPPAGSCTPRARPASASACATPAPTRWWRAWATTAAST